MLMLMSNADADAYALASLTKTICANFDPFVSLLKYHIDKDLAYQTPLPLLGKLIKKIILGGDIPNRYCLFAVQNRRKEVGFSILERPSFTPLL